MRNSSEAVKKEKRKGKKHDFAMTTKEMRV
jgi:hypothetical protein